MWFQKESQFEACKKYLGKRNLISFIPMTFLKSFITINQISILAD